MNTHTILLLPFTVRAELIDRPNKKGLLPIKLIVTIKGRRTTKSLGERIEEIYWDKEKQRVKKTHPEHIRINAKIDISKNSLIADLRKKQLSGEVISVKNLKSSDRSFTAYFQGYIDSRVSVVKPQTLRHFSDTLKRIKEFDADVSFGSLDTAWLRAFHQKLSQLEFANNTVHRHWKKLRAVYTSAFNEGIVSKNPFKQYKNPQYIQTDRTYLTEEEIESWERAMLKPMPEEMLLSGYYFLLGCYSGLRISDWKRFNGEFIQGDRLILRAQKNNQLISLQMHSKLKRIVDILLPMKPCPVDQIVNENLKYIAGITEKPKISKVVTAHVARHSFAVRCASLGISPEVTAKLMGISKRTVMVYYKVLDRRVDEEFSRWDK